MARPDRSVLQTPHPGMWSSSALPARYTFHLRDCDWLCVVFLVLLFIEWLVITTLSGIFIEPLLSCNFSEDSVGGLSLWEDRAVAGILLSFSNTFMQEAMGWRKPSWRRAQICSPYAMLCLCTHRPQTHSSRPLYAHRLPRVRSKVFGFPPPLPDASLPRGSHCPLALREDPGTSSERPSNSRFLEEP